MFWRRRQSDADFREEIRSHIEVEKERLIGEGMNPDEARSAAYRSFGNVTASQERFYESKRIVFWDSLKQDLQYAVRMFGRQPAFVSIVVLTLALGIGATTAMLSLLDAVLLRPLPFQHADRLVMVWEDQTQYGFPQGTPAPANFADWKAQNHVFTEMAAMVWQNFNLTGDGDPQHVVALRVTAGFFPVLETKPTLGRTFRPEEDSPDGNRTVILSHALWQQRFGGNPALVGRDISLDGIKHTVIGIMPPEFQFPSREVQLWVPAAFTPAELAQRDSHYLMVVARMKPGISLAQARTDMAVIARRLEEEYPISNKGLKGCQVIALREQFAGGLRLPLNILLAAGAAVLLIACANVTHLLLARGTARRKEIGVRLAVGAGRARMIRQLLAESVLLATAGAIVGVILATASFQFLARLVPASFPDTTVLKLDATVLVLTTVTALFTAIAVGLVPAFQASHLDLNTTLKKAGSRGSDRGSGRLRNVLVIVEVTLTVMLLVATGLLVESYSRARTINPGFQPEGLLTVETPLSASKYASPSRRIRFYQQVLERLGALPGITSAGYVNYLPLTFKGGTVVFSIEGRPVPPPGQLPVQTANDRFVSSDYFRTMGIPLIRGRHFDERDSSDASRVVIINETMARTFWPTEDPLGRRVHFGYGLLRPGQPEFTIAGVVGDVRQMGLDVPTNSEMYFPLTQSLPGASFSWPRHLVIRTTGNPMRLVEEVRNAIRAVDPDQPIANIRTMDEILDGDVSNRRTQTSLLTAFSVLALLLASVGIYGVLSYTVAERTQEIGLRMALGASRIVVVGGIVRQTLRLTVFGIGLGLAGAFVFTRAFSSLLFKVSPSDPATFGLVALTLITVATAACYLPARRAAAVNPVVALRSE